LSMDYEVFLVSRIREFWLASGVAGPTTSGSGVAGPTTSGSGVAGPTTSGSGVGEPTTSGWVRTRADNYESVVLGIARTGRVITAAALIMSISFAALIAAHVSFMRMFGLGLTLAVLADATLVRMVLVPAFMHVMGQWNWWAPKWMVVLHQRLGFNDGHAVATTESEQPLQADFRNGFEEIAETKQLGRNG
jgi:putative drug exporter of the RND superfamily